jgi:hypothetical protein
MSGADKFLARSNITFRVSRCRNSQGAPLQNLVDRFCLQQAETLVLSFSCKVIAPREFDCLVPLASTLRTLDVAQWRQHHCATCPLTGPWPLLFDCANLAALTRLESLTVGTNIQAFNTGALTALSSLCALSLRTAMRGYEPRELSSLTALHSLRLFTHQHQECDQLTMLTALTDLDVEYSEPLIPLRTLTALTSLQSLRVSANAGICGLKSLLVAAPRLRCLTLSRVCDWRLKIALYTLCDTLDLRFDRLELQWCVVDITQLEVLLRARAARHIALYFCTLAVNRFSTWNAEVEQLARTCRYTVRQLAYVESLAAPSCVSPFDQVQLSGNFILESDPTMADAASQCKVPHAIA